MEEGRAAYQLYVAAETFVAAWLVPGGKPTAPFTEEQTSAGFAALQRRLQGTGSSPAATLVVLEATGNYWVARTVSKCASWPVLPARAPVDTAVW